MTDTGVYQALGLQVNCRAVNMMSVEDARQSIFSTIEHVDSLLTGSQGFLRSFAGAPATLVVLPEYFLTSFPMGDTIEGWQAKGCIEMDGQEYEKLSAVAQKHNIYLSGNAYELDPNFPQLYFQTSFIIGPSGDVILRYRRLVSMFGATPHDVLDAYLDIYGEEGLFPVVDTPIGRLACVASEEILYPEITRAHVLRGAEVICHSSSEVGSLQDTPKNIAKRARAYENIAYVVSANSASITDIPFPADRFDAVTISFGIRNVTDVSRALGEMKRVLKGGSWASPRWILRRSFRNFYEHGVRQILAGFRCATDA